VADVFISYSRRDVEFVRRLARVLEDRGKELWVDMDDIGPAAPWREEIRRGVESCDGFVFVLTPDSLASVECGKELTLAVELSKRIVPVVHVDVDHAEVPEAVASLNWVRLRDGDDFDAGLAALLQALEQDLEWVRAHTRLGERAEEWVAHGRGGAYLLRGSDLVDAEAMVTAAAGKDPPLSSHQLTYVAAGRGASRRRQRWLLGSVTIALVVAVVLSLVALHERGTAVSASHRAQSRQLAAQAELQLGTDAELSVLLAERAYDVDPTAESVATLRHALVNSFIRMRVQPEDGVSTAQLTPDGATLVTAGRTDGVVRRWAYPSGKPLGAIPDVVAEPGQLAVNPEDGRILVLSHGAAEVFTGAHHDLTAGSGVTAVGWDPTGRVLLTGTEDGKVLIRNGTTGDRGGYAYGLAGPVMAVAENVDDTLVAATADNQLLLADFRTPTVSVHVLDTDCACSRLTFSPDGSRLLAYGSDVDASVLLDTDKVQPVRGYLRYSARAAAFSPNGQALVVGGVYAVSIDPTNGRSNGEYDGHTGPIEGVAFLTAGADRVDLAATASEDGTVRAWNPAVPASTVATLRADETALAALTATPDGRHLVTVDGDGRTVRVWADPLPTSEAEVGDLLSDGALSPDGRYLLTRDDDGLALSDASDGTRRRVFAGSAQPVDLFSAVGSTGFVADAATAYEATTAGVLAWHTSDGRSLPGYALAADAAGDVPVLVAPATDSSSLLVGLGPPVPGESAQLADRLDLVDLGTGTTRRVSDQPVTAFAISPDGTRTAFATDQGVVVESGGRSVTVDSGSGEVQHLAFSADGARLAVAGGDTVRVVAADDGQKMVSLSVPGVDLTSVALDRVGDRVAAGGADGRARVWSVPAGRLLMTGTEASTPDSRTEVDLVSLAPAGDFLVTGVSVADTELWDTSDGVRLYAWPSTYAGWSPAAHRVLTVLGAAETWSCEVCVDGRELRALAARSTTRDLTAAERDRFLTP